jgi:hypothetical protein
MLGRKVLANASLSLLGPMHACEHRKLRSDAADCADDEALMRCASSSARFRARISSVMICSDPSSLYTYTCTLQYSGTGANQTQHNQLITADLYFIFHPPNSTRWHTLPLPESAQ